MARFKAGSQSSLRRGRPRFNGYSKGTLLSARHEKRLHSVGIKLSARLKIVRKLRSILGLAGLKVARRFESPSLRQTVFDLRVLREVTP
jgi:hypothetical protein